MLQEIEKAVVERHHHARFGQGIRSKPRNAFAERKYVGVHVPQASKPLPEMLRSDEQMRKPFVFVLDRKTVVAQNQEPLLSPLRPLHDRKYSGGLKRSEGRRFEGFRAGRMQAVVRTGVSRVESR